MRVTKAAKAGGEKLYTLHTSEQPAGEVVRKIAGDLGKGSSTTRASLNQLKQPVKLDLEEVTIDYLLETILKPLKLTYRITDEAVEDRPGELGRSVDCYVNSRRNSSRICRFNLAAKVCRSQRKRAGYFDHLFGDHERSADIQSTGRKPEIELVSRSIDR